MPDEPGCPCSSAGPPTPPKGSFDLAVGVPVPAWPNDLWGGWPNPAPSSPGASGPGRSSAQLALLPPREPLRQSDLVPSQSAPAQAILAGTARCPRTTRIQAAANAPVSLPIGAAPS